MRYVDDLWFSVGIVMIQGMLLSLIQVHCQKTKKTSSSNHASYRVRQEDRSGWAIRCGLLAQG